MNRIALVSLLALTASACHSVEGDDSPGGGGGGGGDGDVDGGVGSGSGSGSGSGDGSGDGDGGSITPQAGRWFYDEITPVSSNCPNIIDEGQAGAFAVTQVSAAGFLVVPEDGADPFACTLTGAAYDCPDRVSHVEDYRPAADAVITIHAIASGTFASPTRAAGRQIATVGCAGAQCNSFGVGQLPCTFTVDFVVRAY